MQQQITAKFHPDRSTFERMAPEKPAVGLYQRRPWMGNGRQIFHSQFQIDAINRCCVMSFCCETSRDFVTLTFDFWRLTILTLTTQHLPNLMWQPFHNILRIISLFVIELQRLQSDLKDTCAVISDRGDREITVWLRTTTFSTTTHNGMGKIFIIWSKGKWLQGGGKFLVCPFFTRAEYTVSQKQRANLGKLQIRRTRTNFDNF